MLLLLLKQQMNQSLSGIQSVGTINEAKVKSDGKFAEDTKNKEAEMRERKRSREEDDQPAATQKTDMINSEKEKVGIFKDLAAVLKEDLSPPPPAPAVDLAQNTNMQRNFELQQQQIDIICEKQADMSAKQVAMSEKQDEISMTQNAMFQFLQARLPPLP